MLRKSEFPLMQKDRKTHWIGKLTSNKYQQGSTFFYSELTNEYCPLGLLLVVRSEMENDKDLDSYLKTVSVDNHAFTNEMLNWCGMSRKFHDQIVLLNDVFGFTFKEIAHWLDRNIRVHN